GRRARLIPEALSADIIGGHGYADRTRRRHRPRGAEGAPARCQRGPRRGRLPAPSGARRRLLGVLVPALVRGRPRERRPRDRARRVARPGRPRLRADRGGLDHRVRGRDARRRVQGAESAGRQRVLLRRVVLDLTRFVRLRLGAIASSVHGDEESEPIPRRRAPSRWRGPMVSDRVMQAAETVRSYAASPSGRHMRRTLGTTLTLGSPLYFRLPGLRRYPVLRIVEVLGGAALLVALGERLRDWEPNPRSRSEITTW